MKRSMTFRSCTWLGFHLEWRCRGVRRPLGGKALRTPRRDGAFGEQGARRLSPWALLLARVGLAGAKELLGCGAAFCLGLGAARSLKGVGAVLRGHQVLDLKLLLGAQCEQLVRCLLGLQRTFGTLALGDDLAQR